MQLSPHNPLFSRSQKIVIVADDAQCTAHLLASLTNEDVGKGGVVPGHQTHCDFRDGCRLHLQLWTCSASNKRSCSLMLDNEPLVFICFPKNDDLALSNASSQWLPLIVSKSPKSRVIFLEIDGESERIHPLSFPQMRGVPVGYEAFSLAKEACLDRLQVFSWLWMLTNSIPTDSFTLSAASHSALLVAAA